MKQQDFTKNPLEEVPAEKFARLTKEELIEFALLEQKVRIQFENEVIYLRALNEELKQKSFLFEEQYVTVKNKLFGRSSEKEPRSEDQETSNEDANKKKPKKQKVQLPSLRYPYIDKPPHILKLRKSDKTRFTTQGGICGFRSFEEEDQFI